MQINERTIGLLKDAHKFFEHNKEANAYIKYRSGDEKYMDFMVEKGSWYRGEGYHLWDGSVYVASFSPEWIAGMFPKEEIKD